MGQFCRPTYVEQIAMVSVIGWNVDDFLETI